MREEGRKKNLASTPCVPVGFLVLIHSSSLQSFSPCGVSPSIRPSKKRPEILSSSSSDKKELLMEMKHQRSEREEKNKFQNRTLRCHVNDPLGVENKERIHK